MMKVWGFQKGKENVLGLVCCYYVCYTQKIDLTKVEGLVCKYKIMENYNLIIWKFKGCFENCFVEGQNGVFKVKLPNVCVLCLVGDVTRTRVIV